MKKVIITLATFLTISCKHKGDTKNNYTKRKRICIENLETMEKWLQEDYQNGDIPRHVAQNYMYIIVNTKCGLKKKIKANDDDCTN